MKKKKRWTLSLALILSLAVTACSAVPGMGEKQTEFEVGEKVSTYWFDFTVNSVETTDCYGDYEAAEGNRLAVCDVTIKNTFGDTVLMNWADFVLVWGDGEDNSAAGSTLDGMKGSYPLQQYDDGQLPDEYEIEKGDVRQGVLVFEVPEEITEVAVVFQELYAEGESESQYSQGESYTVWFALE